MKKLFIFFFFFVNIASMFALFDKYEKYTKSGYGMGTDLTIIIFCNDAKKSEILLNQCFTISENLENIISSRKSNTIIFKLNRDKKAVIENTTIINMLKDSLDYSKITNGAFDVSLYNISELWGFETDNNRIPSASEIVKTLKQTGYKNITVKDNLIELKNNVSLDFGSCAKKRIMTEIGLYLTKEGIKDYLINGGGDILIKGKFGGVRLWKIAIANPYNKDNIIGNLDLTNCYVVTSGDYERFFIGKDGKKYHHIIDPATGYPTDNGIHSVTIITKDPKKAEFMSTSLFVMGEKKGLEFINSNYHDIEVIFISGTEKQMKLVTTNGIKTIKKTDDYYFEITNKKIIE